MHGHVESTSIIDLDGISLDGIFWADINAMMILVMPVISAAGSG